MPNCPRCLKHFSSERGVKFHLSQPLCPCHDNNYAFALEVPHLPANDAPCDVRQTHAVDSPMRSPSPGLPNFDLPDEPLAGFVADEADVEIDDAPPFPEERHPHLWVTDYFGGASATYGTGDTFLSWFDKDQYSERRRSNPYYPFASSKDWMEADFLSKSRLSMALIDDCLSMDVTKDLPLSFHTARDLRSRIESLPSGPRWSYRTLSLDHETKDPVCLYYRDALDCVKLLFNHPLFADKMEFAPYRQFTSAERDVRIYTEWMSSDSAWELQEKIPIGGTLCGVILSSDKTNITNVSGGKAAHPLLLSIANIKMHTRNKASAHAFLLLALLPIPEFIEESTRICSVLNARLYHHCLDIILQPLKDAMRHGCTMPDPLGNLRYCFTPLVSFIADTPEACLVACVRGKTSPVTTASHKDFGDPFRHPSRTASLTKRQLKTVEHLALHIEEFFAACEDFRLNGVSFPFWGNWRFATPSRFLTPEPLHYWHRESWDHDVKWCRIALGDRETDFRFSVVPNITGLRHFNNGITKLKQVGGRTQRDVQRYLVVVIAGGATPGVVTAIRALMEFRYLSQAPAITSQVQDRIQAALDEFHQHKQAILDAGLRRGKKIMNHFRIPKLELMQSVAPSIPRAGCLLQWSADTTEHAHIEVVKDPASMTNHHDYYAQICCTLDRDEKRRLFATAICLKTSQNQEDDSKLDGTDEDKVDDADNSDDADVERVDDNTSPTNVLADLWSPKRQSTNFFKVAVKAADEPTARNSSPPRTIIAGSVAIHLNIEPTHRRRSIDEVAEEFGLPDLRGALADYVSRQGQPRQRTFHTFSGPRRSGPNAVLPFTELQVWHKVRLQQKSYHRANELGPTFTINAHPPNRTWKHGRYDAAILQVDQAHQWPLGGLTGTLFLHKKPSINSKLLGHSVVLVRLIMCPASPKCHHSHWTSRALVYAQRLDVVPQRDGQTESTTGLHVLRRVTRSSGEGLGEVFPLDQLKSYAHIVPRFGRVADNRLTYSNSVHGSQSFFLNKYFDKDFFYAISKAL
ncbi:hypothetical protein L210DRAFT_3616586 [Boletus edulis BED1]|uniref:DUF6830 domain-containing protein n=1 Tax=Boletus edulis BED1 TaxID=1328754 RepID=A0AAD4G694_BOLED|nr:hypothetical protein L210DRAFT_3616586 [Boletus edulis BED1]